jgi:hypothetical protein
LSCSRTVASGASSILQLRINRSTFVGKRERVWTV